MKWKCLMLLAACVMFFDMIYLENSQMRLRAQMTDLECRLELVERLAHGSVVGPVAEYSGIAVVDTRLASPPWQTLEGSSTTPAVTIEKREGQGQ